MPSIAPLHFGTFLDCKNINNPDSFYCVKMLSIVVPNMIVSVIFGAYSYLYL